MSTKKETRPKWEPYADPADICELAHWFTERDCYEQDIEVDCDSVKKCKDKNNGHKKNDDMTHYTKKAQDIFDFYYDLITNTLNI